MGFEISFIPSGSQPPPSVPSTNLAVHLDAENSDFTFSGSDVTQWNDISGNGNHATIGLDGTPQRDDGTLIPNPNGKPFVTDRTDNYGFFITNSTTITVHEAFFVTRFFQSTWFTFQGWINPVVIGNPYWTFGSGGGKTINALAFDSFFQNNTEYAPTEPFSVDLDVWAIYHMRSSAGLTHASTGFNIGHLETFVGGGLDGRAWQGDWAEVLIYDGVLSSEDVTAALDNLSVKYDITIA